MSVRGATFLGVGSMVGAGIFALLGEAGAVAGSATWLSFALAGAITALLGYTVVKLGVRYPSSGGFIEYLRVGYGNGHILGIASWLGYFALVIMSAMVAVSFGEYSSSLLLGDNAAAIWVKVLATAIIVVMTAVNIRGSDVVDKLQSVIVITVLSVFAIFVVSTFGSLDPSLLAPSTYPPLSSVVSSIALTFFAFLGFAVVTFSTGDLAKPSRDLPRAMYWAIGIAALVYVAVSLAVFGVLTVTEVIDNGSTAIAVAAEPALGSFGFTLMSLAAMFATASSTNANLYGAGHLTQMLGTIRQFPATFSRTTRRGSPNGLLITAGLALLMANAFDLTAIASIGTCIALSLFALVTVAGIRLRAETGARIVPMALAICAILIVLVGFLRDTLQSEPRTVYTILLFGLLAVVCDYGWKALDRRHEEGGRRTKAPG